MVSRITELFEKVELDDGWKGFEDLEEEEDDFANIRDEDGQVENVAPESLVLIDPA